MGIVSQYRQDITSGIDEALVDKIGLATLTTTAKNLSGAVNELNARTTELGTDLEATQVWIADEYDTTRTYAVDDMVSYENELYKCITAVTSPEAFDENKWEATGVSYELSQHDSKLRQHDSDISALNSRLSKLGIFENGGFSSITVSPGTWVKCKEYTLNNPGVYILNSIVSFTDHNTSIYTHRVSVGSNNYNIRNNASNGGGSNLSLIISISTPTTIQLYVNAAFATTANGNLQCVRLT